MIFGFFGTGVTSASLRGFGMCRVASDLLTISVRIGSAESIHCLSKNGGKGFRAYVLILSVLIRCF